MNFIPTAPCEKTSKMREVEKRMGRTLEEDFNEYYLLKRWGYKRLANRWGVNHNTICVSRKRNGFRSWVEILDLPARRESSDKVSLAVSSPTCEICDESDVQLDDAHWVADRDGGSTKSCNSLKLCPNCHRKLDRDEPATIELCREKLLFREVKKMIENSSATPKHLRNLVEAILHRRHLE
jgi:hypothetical protein